MPERSYPCEFCDSDQPLVERRVTLPMQRNGRWYIFEEVPAQVCRQCGHRYFDGPLLLKLEQIMLADTPSYAHPIEAWTISLADVPGDPTAL